MVGFIGLLKCRFYYGIIDAERKTGENTMGANILGVDYVPHANAVRITFITGIIVFTVCWFTARALICFFRKRFDIKHEALLILVYINLAVLFRITFFPLYHDESGSIQPLIFDTGDIFPLNINLVPFQNIFDFSTTKDMLINIVGNITMFIPTGIILPMIYKKLRSFPRTTLAGGLISLSIEIIQLPFCERTSDINDLILNTLGVVLGYGIYASARRLARKA